MQNSSPVAIPPMSALHSLLECRDRAREIARQQLERLRAIRTNTSTRSIKENQHD